MLINAPTLHSFGSKSHSNSTRHTHTLVAAYSHSKKAFIHGDERAHTHAHTHTHTHTHTDMGLDFCWEKKCRFKVPSCFPW